jgi:glycosyltransferase involved in cell wall biosynthesis
MNPKITIGITAYNYGNFLEDCIESAYNQTTPAHEIIICNDGSTDNTKEIAERYMFKEFPGVESPVKVINQVNKGLPSARNSIIMNATGDYVIFLDADDILKENAVERVTQIINETNADIIAPSFSCFGKYNQDVILTAFKIEDLKQNNRLGYFSAIRRSALQECGGYSPKMKWGYEDYHLWFDLFCRGKSIIVLGDILVLYRTKDGSMIETSKLHHTELMEQIRNDFPQVWR